MSLHPQLAQISRAIQQAVHRKFHRCRKALPGLLPALATAGPSQFHRKLLAAQFAPKSLRWS